MVDPWCCAGSDGGGVGGQQADVAGQPEEVDEVIDLYSAVELRTGDSSAAATQLVVAMAQPLDGWRPVAFPSCTDLAAGAVVLSAVRTALPAALGGGKLH